jgi:aspartate-semialdehyde dehydrogenase
VLPRWTSCTTRRAPFSQGRETEPEHFAHRIAFNCIPQIDVFLDDGSTKEEWKMVVETKKIMHAPDLAVIATCVRVPVLRCHSEALHIEFERPVALAEARRALEAAPGITVLDDPSESLYPMPALLEGTDDTYIGRLRTDPTVPNGLAMWVVSTSFARGLPSTPCRSPSRFSERAQSEPTAYHQVKES